MRKIYLLLISTLLVGINLSAQDHQWPLSADVNDVVGTLHATNENVTFATDAERGDVAVFNGADATVLLPQFANGLDAMTLAIWHKPGYTNEWRCLFELNQDYDQRVRFIPSNGIDGKAELVVKWITDNDVMWPGAYGAFEQDQWQQIVVTFTPSRIAVYKDGIKFIEKNSIKNIFEINDIHNMLGRNEWGDWYLGAMSDVRVYNSVLTDIDIAKLYTETEMATDQIEGGFAINNIAQKTGNIDVVLNAPGKVYFTLRGSGDPAPDVTTVVTEATAFGLMIAVPSANTVESFAITEAYGGQPETNYVVYFIAEDASAVLQANPTAVHFKSLAYTDEFNHWPLTSDVLEVENGLDGTDMGITFEDDVVRGPVANFSDGYVEFPSVLKGLDEATIGLWFRMDEERPWSRLWSIGNTNEDPWYREGMWLIPANGIMDDQKMWLELPDIPYWWQQGAADPVKDLGVWHHSVLTFTDQKAIAYLDGVQIFEIVTPVPIGEMADTMNYLGNSYWPDPYFGGKMSDFRIYSKAFSGAEVTTFYNDTKIDPPAVPGIVSGYPAITNIGETSATLEVQLDAVGEVFYNVRLASDDAPTAADLVTMNVKLDVASASSTVSADIAELIVGTDYTAYVVAGNGAGDVQESVSEVDFSTDPDGISSSGMADFRIYPNPTSGIVRLTSNTKISSVEVYSISGSIVMTVAGNHSNDFSIDMNDTADGIYFIHIKSLEGDVKVSKIVKN